MKLFLFLTSLLLLTSLHAEDNDYSIIINKKFNNQLLDIKQDYNRDITAIGFTNNYKTTPNKKTYTDAFEYLSSVSASHGTQMQLVKTNAAGQILIDKSTNLSKFSEAVSITKTPTNGYYVGGHTMDGQLILLKLDASTNIIFK